jgi:hypothetical protein
MRKIIPAIVTSIALLLILSMTPKAQVIIQGVLQQGTTAFTGNLLFSPTNTYNIGVAGCATGCPANAYIGGTVGGNLFAANTVGSAGGFAVGADYMIQTNAPTITSGFGTSPSFGATSAESSFTLILGTPVGQTGVVGFPTNFQHVPPFYCYDRTTAAANPLTILPTVSQITITGTVMVAGDNIDCFSVSH